ncbi:MAG: dTMP kinase [Thermoplasmata archaeon]
MKGKFITVEGIDGSGKSTLIPMLRAFLEDKGWEVVVTTEPTDTWLGKNVKKGFTEEISPFTETFLFLADRCEHTKWILSEMEQGKIVLCDRYADSTYAYQGAALENLIEKPMDWLIEISKHIVVEPDITILLVASPETVVRRIAPRGEWTKFERLEYLRKVNENYLKLGARFSRIKVVDAEQSIEKVFESAKKILEEWIGGKEYGRV